MFCVWVIFKTRQTTDKKLMLQGYNASRLKSLFCKFYSRYNDLICDYKLSLAHNAERFVSYSLLDCNLHTGFEDV
jgi:hypothetical protein